MSSAPYIKVPFISVGLFTTLSRDYLAGTGTPGTAGLVYPIPSTQHSVPGKHQLSLNTCSMKEVNSHGCPANQILLSL